MAAWAIAALAIVASCGATQDSYGPWEVRRGRTTDSDTAGGYPTWTVTFSGDEEAPDVRIDGDEGPARGTILIGRRIVVDEGELPGLSFSYATFCAMDTRSGAWDLAAIDPEVWDALGTEPETDIVYDPRSAVGSVRLKGYGSEDTVEPEPVDASMTISQAMLARRMPGREVILAAVWTGYHGTVEWAGLEELKLVTITRGDTLKGLFDRLDLDRPGLEAVKAAVEAEEYETAAEALLTYFRGRTTPEYPGDPRRKEEHTASDADMRNADAALENRFIGQSAYGLQKVPDDIDWSFNPGKDPEWTWQFNRHGAWRSLAAAYLATGDAKYAEKWRALMRDWVDENPPGTPWSWRTLEAGIRAQGWLPVYFSFLEWDGLTPEDHAVFLASLADHAEYLVPEGRFHSGSNWGQTESLGLLSLGSFFPEFHDAETWRDTAWERLEAEMFRQVLEDGAQVELTTSYHQGCISGFIRAADIAEIGGATISDEYWDRLERMYEYTMILQKPDNTQPMLGDSWPGNTSGTLRAGARRFDRPDMLYVGTDGREGEPPSFLDAALPAAGYYVMRTDWVDDQAIYALTDVAHHWGGGHQQPDCLQLNLYAFGKTLLPDSGSYLYYGPERAQFARTASHSTVTVDDANQNTSAATLHCFGGTEALSFVDGEQAGYPGVSQRRQVLFARPVAGSTPYLVVIDRITGEGTHALDQYWHFLPAPLEVDGMQARTAEEEGPNLLVQALATEGVTMEEVESWVSFRYTEKEPRPAVRFRAEGDLPRTFATLLVPYPGAEPPELTATLLSEGPVVKVQVQGDEVDDLLFAATEAAEVDLRGTSVEARAALQRLDADGKPSVLAVINDE